MKLRAALLAAVLLAPAPLAAQDTLADIQAELGRLSSTIASLRQELVTTGASGGGQVAGSALDRMNALEAELARLTAKTEALEQRINRVVADGTNRIGELKFRICEMETGCDVSKIGETPPLGGDAGAAPAPTTTPAVSGGAELAVGEKADFDRAKEALDSGSFRSAADLFASFAQAYPGSPLMGEAYYLQGEALLNLGETKEAARAWLAGYTADKTGPRAAETLLKLGLALNTLGQTPDACAILGEVSNRFPDSDAAKSAVEARATMACG